jgi:hypothetical protein
MAAGGSSGSIGSWEWEVEFGEELGGTGLGIDGEELNCPPEERVSAIGRASGALIGSGMSAGLGTGVGT